MIAVQESIMVSGHVRNPSSAVQPLSIILFALSGLGNRKHGGFSPQI
jgi:hypothetical protein